ncbi:peptidoglycan binding domain-containing protein [Colletotrichum asianum]
MSSRSPLDPIPRTSCTLHRLDEIADDSFDFHPCAHIAAGPGEAEHIHTKRLIVCCDGTWNNSNAAGNISTNVTRLSSAIAHKCCSGMPQVVYYHPGPGTEESKIAQGLGGLLGLGVISDIADTYRFICDNYSPGDEIIILGFSRGAFVARSVAGMVCSLGLLNRFGLANFGAIFSDYQNFSEWDENTEFDPKKHLRGFDIHNSDQVTHEMQSTMNKSNMMILETRDNEKMEKDLQNQKRAIFYELTGRSHKKRLTTYDLENVDETLNADEKAAENKKVGNLQRMANIYRKHLNERFRMLLCDKKNRNDPDGRWEPVEPEIKALGVWDTVGSLGLPKMPFGIDKIRSAQELRFASFKVHPKIHNAFHALALDEWRTSFAPTLWTNNGTTNLRQVWFPGGHSDVGGGVEDNQIATISLAWMADQLTSVGVEFTASEMLRIFRTVDLYLEQRPWALGRISNPGITGLPDKAWDTLLYPVEWVRGGNTYHGTRTPGLYKEEEKATENVGGEEVRGHELVHPSVRIRYLHGGKDLDDNGIWQCRALTRNGYSLSKAAEARPEHLQSPPLTYATTFNTLAGTISSVQGDKNDVIEGLDDRQRHRVVPRQLPFEEDLYTPLPNDNFDWVEEEDLYNYEGTLPKTWVWKSDKTTLHEERIGNWERLYLLVNQGHLGRAKERKSFGQEKTEDTQGSSSSGQGWWPFSGNSEAEKIKRENIDKRPYGYWDFITWQQGDTRPRQQRKRIVSKKMDKDGNVISFTAVLAQ